jgi:hypothetical protein
LTNGADGDLCLDRFFPINQVVGGQGENSDEMQAKHNDGDLARAGEGAKFFPDFH